MLRKAACQQPDKLPRPGWRKFVYHNEKAFNIYFSFGAGYFCRLHFFTKRLK